VLQAFLDETKCTSALPKVIVTGYKELNLIYYFTAGETEVGVKFTLQTASLALYVGSAAATAAGVLAEADITKVTSKQVHVCYLLE
jgi:obg-like ATPase 1